MPKSKPSYSDEMIGECLDIMQSAEIDMEDLFEIIPRVGVLRDRRFHKPLNDLLFHSDNKRREFAAYAMGAMGDRVFLEPLRKAFLESQKVRGFGADDFQVAVIEAIGAIGDDAAVDFFLPILQSPESGKERPQIRRWIVESLGAVAQQGGERSLEALIELTRHHDPETQALALSELSVAYWHRPNDIADSTLSRIHDLTTDADATVAEAALAALQSLADVGCRRAEKLFATEDEA